MVMGSVKSKCVAQLTVVLREDGSYSMTNNSPVKAKVVAAADWGLVLRELEGLAPKTSGEKVDARKQEFRSIKTLIAETPGQTIAGSFRQKPPETPQPACQIPMHSGLLGRFSDTHPLPDWPSVQEIGAQLAELLPTSVRARRKRIYRLRRGNPLERSLAALLSWWRPL